MQNVESASGDWSVIYIIPLMAASTIEDQDLIVFGSRDPECASWRLFCEHSLDMVAARVK